MGVRIGIFCLFFFYIKTKILNSIFIVVERFKKIE